MKHKKQHYIPQSYLAAWVDPATPDDYEPYTWVVDKRNLSIKSRAPKNILFKTDFYTIETEEGDRDLSLEHILSKLEGNFVQVRDSKIVDQIPLDFDDHLNLISYVAAMHSRTPASGDRMKPFWQELLDKMITMNDWASKASDEEIVSAAQVMPVDPEHSHIVTVKEIQEIVDAPVPSLLAPSIHAEVEQLMRLDLALIRTRTSPGYITSDNPVVWFDPESHNRPPPYQGPALIYPSIEISMPISPAQSLLLNRRGWSGYIDLGEFGPKVDLEVVNRANWRTRAAANGQVVVNSEVILWDWFF